MTLLKRIKCRCIGWGADTSKVGPALQHMSVERHALVTFFGRNSEEYPLPPPPLSAPDVELSATPRNENLQSHARQALERLIEIAQRDTGQSRRVADFLLSWWNSGTCGAFDLTTLWGVDSEIAADIVTVFALIARVNSYLDSLDYESEFKSIVGCLASGIGRMKEIQMRLMYWPL